MATIVTEIMEILKGSYNTILREENLMPYFFRSYRATATAVNLLTPVSISPEKVRNMVQTVGERHVAWEAAQEENISK